MIRHFKSLNEDLKIWGINPGFHSMDNEESTALTLTMMNINVKYQLVPTINHRANNTEREIQKSKNYFIEGLWSVEKYFHHQLRDKLLHKATISINMLRQSRTIPNISAYTHIFGKFDFNRTPLSPPGTRVVIHNKPNVHASWDPHGENGWYIGPEM